MKKVIITGGSGGIGSACVRAFAAQGCHVAFTYHSHNDAAKSLSQETGAAAVAADFADIASARAAACSAISALGGVDILVNCAGISQIKLFGDITDRDWQKMLDTNLSAVFAVTQEATNVMLRRHSGKIINIGSVWGNTGAACEVHYSAAKAGLRGMTRALARELGPSGITVNCIEPGVIDTAMNGELDDSAIRALIDRTPLCRLGTPADVANAVLFLASDAADFITGTVLPVDGGFPS